jgi:hypothetical protein
MVDPITTVIIGALGSHAAKPLILSAAKWLADNSQITDVLQTATSKGVDSKAVQDFILWLGDRIGSDNQRKNIPDPPKSLQFVPLEKAPQVAATLVAAERATGEAPGHLAFVGDDKKVEIVDPERRVGLGTTRMNGVPQPLMLVASSSNPIIAETAKRPTSLNLLVVGHASAVVPTKSGDKVEIVVPDSEHRPGRSVAHYRYYAGSLGAYVTYKETDTNRAMRGFVGAAHVLSNVSGCEVKDAIYSPGPPDEQRAARFHYGSLADWSPLAHYQGQLDPDMIMNDADIALVGLRDFTPNAANLVPDPNNPRKLIQLDGDPLTPVEVRDHTMDDVFMIGRTTKFSRGKLKATDIEQYPVRMPNRKNYMFTALCLIESDDPKRSFSQSGDSGAIVYVVKGKVAKALGFVVGGVGSYTFVSLASTCLSAVKARLLA